MRYIFLLLLSFNAYAEITADIDASRTNCVSPCTIIFSAQDTKDTDAIDEHDVFKHLTYSFNFDDINSGNHKVTGLSRNTQVGGPIASHTFNCSNASCSYIVRVRAQNKGGYISDAYIPIVVSSADFQYLSKDTICVSESSNFAGCPEGAMQTTSLPSVGEYSNKRVRLRSGDVFNGSICIDYEERNVLIDSFGDGVKPELTGNINIGVNGRCGFFEMKTDRAIELGTRWAENITVTGLRATEVSMGMAYYNVGLHDLDMNYKDNSAGGYIEMTNLPHWCRISSNLDCSVTPYPYGLYMDELEVVGSNVQAINRTGHGVLIAAYSCPMINWLSLSDTTFWNSYSNQFRIEGAQRISISHNNARGHTKGPNDRHTLALRSCGYTDIDVGQAIESGTGRNGTDEGEIGSPWTRWVVLANNTHGSTDATKLGWKLQIAPTSSSKTETIVDAIVENSTFIGNGTPSVDIAVNGFHIEVRDNIESGDEFRDHCQDIGPGANPIRGFIDCDGESLLPVITPKFPM